MTLPVARTYKVPHLSMSVGAMRVPMPSGETMSQNGSCRKGVQIQFALFPSRCFPPRPNLGFYAFTGQNKRLQTAHHGGDVNWKY